MAVLGRGKRRVAFDGKMVEVECFFVYEKNGKAGLIMSEYCPSG